MWSLLDHRLGGAEERRQQSELLWHRGVFCLQGEFRFSILIYDLPYTKTSFSSEFLRCSGLRSFWAVPHYSHQMAASTIVSQSHCHWPHLVCQVPMWKSLPSRSQFTLLTMPFLPLQIISSHPAVLLIRLQCWVIKTPGLKIAKPPASLMPPVWIIYSAICVDAQL